MGNVHFLGVELGSTRIKAVGIDECFRPTAAGDYTWHSEHRDGIWTYSLDEVWTGLRAALAPLAGEAPRAAGISAMMHGYLAFDKDWQLLVPFRTWQNTMTADAAAALTALFGFNIPQRWSIAHLYQAILNGEEHVRHIAHITTLAGYVHHMLTGVNAVGIGEASGIIPIDVNTQSYDGAMLDKFDALIAPRGLGWKIRDILPDVLLAGDDAGKLTANGAALLGGALPVGTPFVPCEGDAETGMTASNAIKARTGNVSAGTSMFAMLVLERPLTRIYPEIDLVATPDGRYAAMVHCNNGTNDMNAWVGILREAAALFGAAPNTGELYTKLYAESLNGDADCGGITVFNYLAGEVITGLDEGRPMVLRRPEAHFTLANLMRAMLLSPLATLRLGMDILSQDGVRVDTLVGHGGFFKTPGVGQRLMSAACGVPVTLMSSAGEGGPYGMALLAAYKPYREKYSLAGFLDLKVFANAETVTVTPYIEDVEGFIQYLGRYKKALRAEEAAAKYT